MKIIRDGQSSVFMSALLIDWSLRRCNAEGCKQMPNTIISPQDGATPVYALCEEHYQQGNKPGGTRLQLEFGGYDAFKA